MLSLLAVIAVEAAIDGVGDHAVPPKMHTIRGRVVDAEGRPLSGVLLVYDGFYEDAHRRRQRWTGTVVTR